MNKEKEYQFNESLANEFHNVGCKNNQCENKELCTYNQFDLLHKTLTGQGYIVSDLHDLGLVKRSQNDRFYDLFRNRIIFPIKDAHGNVVAFSGRTYKNEDDSAKYINSPQTKIFTNNNTQSNSVPSSPTNLNAVLDGNQVNKKSHSI